MKLSHIRNFIAVAECGGAQAAARQLGITQPSITRSIHDLEQELGASLFERSGSGMALTPVGQAVLRRAEGVQAELARIQDEVAQLAGRVSGTVSIGLSFVAHAGLLPKVIGGFRRKAPEVRLEIKTDGESRLVVDLDELPNPGGRVLVGASLAGGRTLPEHAVVLTFDDGYRSLMDYVLPVLQPAGYLGTVFVITQFMDEDRPEYLSWPQDARSP
jgi:DNA-binding transcriptional LysR family regulator